MIPGMLVTIVMPLLVAIIGVDSYAQGSWVMNICILSIVVIPSTLVEYYFTKERVTAESQDDTEAAIFFGYIVPESTVQIIFQPDTIRNFFSWCFAGLPMIGYAVSAIIMKL